MTLLNDENLCLSQQNLPGDSPGRAWGAERQGAPSVHRGPAEEGRKEHQERGSHPADPASGSGQTPNVTAAAFLLKGFVLQLISP